MTSEKGRYIGYSWESVLLDTEVNSQTTACQEKLLTLCDKEVEQGKDHSVTAEHVVTTSMDSCQRHPKTTPDGHSPLQFGPHVTVHLEGQKKLNTDLSKREKCSV